MRLKFGLLTLVFIGLGIHGKVYSQNETPGIPAGLISVPKDPEHYFVVDKSKRTLSVYRAGVLPEHIADYPADIGKNTGDKTRENDKKTPVGIYFLLRQVTPPEIPFDQYGSIAFTTDYPNIFDKRDSKTGSGIWLHAIPDNVPLTRGSRGCVVVRNDVIQILKSYVALEKTPILIFDNVKQLSEDEYKKQKQEFLAHFEAWRKSWAEQDIDSYIRFYDSTFKNADMNYRQWFNHKKKLKKLYKYIQVALSEPIILMNKDQIVIRTQQRYESDLHKDFGEKTIHARFNKENGFKIIREDWKPLTDTGVLPLRQQASQEQKD